MQSETQPTSIVSINHQEIDTPVRDQETVTPVPLRKSAFDSLSGSRLWCYSGLNRPERCGSSSCPCTVSSPSFGNPTTKKEGKKMWNLKDCFSYLFNVLRVNQTWCRKVHNHRYRSWRPDRQWEECRRWGGGNWVCSHTQFFCVIQEVVDSWRRVEKNYSTLWCDTWVDKQDIWWGEVVGGDCEGSVGIQSEGDLLY